MTSTLTVQALESQVGGHPGVLTTENGLLLIKPALKNELAFYQRLQQDSSLKDLRVFTPTFLGTLKLMGKFDEIGSAVSESIIVESVAEEKDKLPVLYFSQSQRRSVLTLYLLSTIHRSREPLIPFPQTQYLRHKAWNGVVR